MQDYIAKVLDVVQQRNHSEPVFLQAVEEVLKSLNKVIEEHPEIARLNVLERMCEPERQLIFRVVWEDDEGDVHVNRGFRTEFNSALGPFKGGLRFHPTVNMGIIKFLGFEQTFKNSLTGLQIGGAKGGADFNPRLHSEGEVMRFCQAFMCELFRHIGDRTDVPAGDMGVGGREIGYLFGQYKRLTNRYDLGVITGKDVALGGSLARKEATGFGCVYFAQEMMMANNLAIEGKRCIVSGSGNVALYAIKKLQELGAIVVACSDSEGTVIEEEGLDFETLRILKEEQRKRISEYAKLRGNAEYCKGEKVWSIPCDYAFPCATQNELDEKDAGALIDNGCRLISEGANMPLTPGAISLFHKAKVLIGPAKAANAGGVAVSALEMQQNASWDNWTFEEVDGRLRQIMHKIFKSCEYYAERYGAPKDYAMGANIAGFLRVSEAVRAHGLV